jgi:putative nucleotidyltransferase with HDIG domain
MSTLRILFVDDEPQVLDGLRRLLRAHRHEWDMSFVGSGGDALALHRAQPFDVVVSDIRMPGMDGVQLLEHIKASDPDTVRIALSGHTEQQELLRAAGTVHRYLAKPCRVDELRTTIERTTALRQVLQRPALLRLVASLGKLPSLPAIYNDLMREMRSPNASAASVGRIVKRDLAMASKLLQLVNSSYFGLRAKVADPVQATVILGTDTVRALVIQAHLYEQGGSKRPGGLDLEALWDHSMAVATAAKHLASMAQRPRVEQDITFLAGLLHDVGRLVLAQGFPGEYRELIREAGGLPSDEQERAALGGGHPEVGAYLLGLWGLPEEAVEALAWHHSPGSCPYRVCCAATAVHVADAAHRAHLDGTAPPALDQLHLAQVQAPATPEGLCDACTTIFTRGDNP